MGEYKPFGEEWQLACRGILSAQIARHPRMQVEDVYKLLHQASLGSEHAAPREASAQAWLDRELADLGPGAEEPLFDPISPDGEILRVHLRPYQQAGLAWEILLAAFLRTGREYRGSTKHLMRYGREAERMALAGLLPYQAGEISRFLADMERRGFPAAHHSGVYLALYRPAYRVVRASFLGRLTSAAQA